MLDHPSSILKPLPTPPTSHTPIPQLCHRIWYHLLDDAGLISTDAIKELEPLITSIEQRLHLDDEASKIALPMPFEPLTDIEYDTLTSVIAQALREFAQQFRASMSSYDWPNSSASTTRCSAMCPIPPLSSTR